MTSASPTPRRSARTPESWDLEEVVATTWAVIAAGGWTPITSDTYERPATKVLVRAVLNGDTAVGDHERAIANCLPAGHARAPAIIAAILHNTHPDRVIGATRHATMAVGTIGSDHLAWIVTAVATQMGRAHRRGLLTPDPGRHRSAPSPAGVLWDRITVTGIVTGVRPIRGFVGGTHNIRLLLDCGQFGVKLISGRAWSEDVELGDEITVSGEVRGHEYWHGWPATLLSDTQPVVLPAVAMSAGRSRRASVRHRFPDTTHPTVAAVARRAVP